LSDVGVRFHRLSRPGSGHGERRRPLAG
jgi:hypothetical protein